MFVRALICSALASVALGNLQANSYMDGILRDLGAVSLGLDPARVYPFQFKTEGNGLTNRDLKVNVSQGSIYGLSTIARKGDCSYGSFGTGKKMGCYVTLDTVRILLNAEVKGDSILAKWHSISTSSVVGSNSLALLELQGKPRSGASVSRVLVYPITLTSSVSQGKLDLNKSRMSGFVNQLNAGLTLQLSSALTETLSRTIDVLARNRLIP